MAGVNEQVTDAVTQTNVKVVAESPSMAMSMVYQAMAQSVSLSMQNATFSQQQMQQIGTAIATVGAQKIMDLIKTP
jgi:hypothetical protein